MSRCMFDLSWMVKMCCEVTLFCFCAKTLLALSQAALFKIVGKDKTPLELLKRKFGFLNITDGNCAVHSTKVTCLQLIEYRLIRKFHMAITVRSAVIGLIVIYLTNSFFAIFVKWEENRPLKANVFLTLTCPLKMSDFWRRTNVRSVLTSKIFYHQVMANLPQNATEIVRFLKYVRNLRFFDKNVFFFEKKMEFFQNR